MHEHRSQGLLAVRGLSVLLTVSLNARQCSRHASCGGPNLPEFGCAANTILHKHLAVLCAAHRQQRDYMLHVVLCLQDRLLVFWASASKQVVAKQQRVLGSLVLSEQAAKAEDDRALPVLLKVCCVCCWLGSIALHCKRHTAMHL